MKKPKGKLTEIDRWGETIKYVDEDGKIWIGGRIGADHAWTICGIAISIVIGVIIVSILISC